MALSQLITIKDVRGGMNNTDEPHSLSDFEVVDARNIDWMQGTIGGKRAGCNSVSIDASVLSRVVPTAASVTTGGGTAVANFNIVVPAATDDGTGTTYTALVFRASTKPNTDITAVTYNGNALTQQAQDNSGSSGRLETWTLANASLAGGTVAVTLAGACDCAALVEFWQKVDQITIEALGAGGLTATPTVTVTPANPTFNVSASFSYNTGVTGTPPLFAPLTILSQGNARLWVAAETGRSPQHAIWFNLSGAVDWVGRGLKLRGAPISAFANTGYTFLAIMRHSPTINISEDELWVVDLFGRIDRRVGGTWQGGVPMVNYWMGIFNATGLDINGASLHGKFFLSAQSAISGTMMWDGTIFRHAGFPQTPTVPSVANTGAAGTYSGTRYFRIRFIEQNGSGVTLRRSEPSASVSFVPSGANTGAVITKPTGTESFTSLYQNGQTHWEVEASLDNVLFYRIATVAVATPTYTDTTALTTTYATSTNTLSEPIGENVPLPAMRHLAVDDDRLMGAGDRQTQAFDSRVRWTPVAAAIGVGNDERIPATTDNFLDLDNLLGGNVKMLIAGESGNVYAFKLERTYKLSRTGILTAAYRPQTESTSRGTLNRGACSGQDSEGSPCVYFIDPSVGLCSISKAGIKQLGHQVLTTWAAAEKGSAVIRGPRMAYWPTKRQVFISYGPDGNDVPTKILCFNAKFGGWAIYESPLFNSGIYGDICIYADVTLPLLPYTGMLNPPLVKFELSGVVNDAGNRYRGYWTSKAYLFGNLFNKFGAMAGVLFARAASATTINIGLIRNLGVSRRNVTTSIAPAATETHVFKPVDNAYLRECFAIQFELGDPPSYTGSQLDQTWSLNQYASKISSEEEGTS